MIGAAESTLHTSLSAGDAASTLRVAAQTGFDAPLAACRNGGGSVAQVERAVRCRYRPFGRLLRRVDRGGGSGLRRRIAEVGAGLFPLTR